MATYVGDLLIASSDFKLLEKEKTTFAIKFDMHGLGEANFVLGMKISRDRTTGRLWINQERYILDLHEKSGMKDCRSISTSLETGKYLEKNKGTSIAIKDYQDGIGSLTYLAIRMRTDITAALRMLSQFASNPGDAHWKAVKHILLYFKGTIDYTFFIYGIMDKDVKICGHVGADWTGDITARKSQSGYIFELHGGPISWLSKQYGVVALSTTEAMYISTSLAAQELLW